MVRPATKPITVELPQYLKRPAPPITVVSPQYLKRPAAIRPPAAIPTPPTNDPVAPQDDSPIPIKVLPFLASPSPDLLIPRWVQKTHRSRKESPRVLQRLAPGVTKSQTEETLRRTLRQASDPRTLGPACKLLRMRGLWSRGPDLNR